MIDKRCRVRIYVQEMGQVYICVAQGSGPCSCIRVRVRLSRDITTRVGSVTGATYKETK
jgi:hypothetical protein